MAIPHPLSHRMGTCESAFSMSWAAGTKTIAPKGPGSGVLRGWPFMAPRYGTRSYASVPAKAWGDTMKVAVGTISAVVALIAVSCASPEPSPPLLPAYTPTPADLYRVYSVALDDLDAALDDVSKARYNALEMVEAAPEVAFNAVREAGGCDVPVDDLTSDPVSILGGIYGILADPRLGAARDVPRTVAHDLAAAHIASPANRAAVEAARSAHVIATALDRPVPSDPVFAAYLGYLDDDPAFGVYLAALKRINTAFLPVSHDLRAAWSDLYQALSLATEFVDCRSELVVIYGDYMAAYELHLPALHAYFEGIRSAIEDYSDALDLARESYAQR